MGGNEEIVVAALRHCDCQCSHSVREILECAGEEARSAYSVQQFVLEEVLRRRWEDVGGWEYESWWRECCEAPDSIELVLAGDAQKWLLVSILFHICYALTAILCAAVMIAVMIALLFASIFSSWHICDQITKQHCLAPTVGIGGVLRPLFLMVLGFLHICLSIFSMFAIVFSCGKRPRCQPNRAPFWIRCVVRALL